MSDLYRLAFIACLVTALLTGSGATQFGMATQMTEQIPLTVDAHHPGAPLTVGIPFPKGTLQSPDHVRLLAEDGREIPAQVTEVTSWAPADDSVKWIWVFFFAGEEAEYLLEYGPDVRRAPITGDRLTVSNSQRQGGILEITTGPLRLQIEKNEDDQVGSGFLDTVYLDRNGDGFGPEDVVARGPDGRGSFLDLVDPTGPDSSRAVITQTFREKGSGPLHTILRIEGQYIYTSEDHPPSPFTLRLHTYAGRSTIRVLHSITYTGDPDRHPPVQGEHALIATGTNNIVNEDSLAGDPRWTQPNDQIAGTGLNLQYVLDGPVQVAAPYQTGDWSDPDPIQVYEGALDASSHLSLMQTGPAPASSQKPDSSPTERIDGFRASVVADSTRRIDATRAPGWMAMAGKDAGIAVGIRHFFEEYPKELSVRPSDTLSTAYAWSPAAPPMNFARSDTEAHAGMVDNFAAGLAKTTEFVYSFHDANTDQSEIERRMAAVLDPPVAHAPPSWYSQSQVYGRMAARSGEHADYERSLDLKLAWWQFNQQWEPWYGMFEHGDSKMYYFRDQWYLWENNEPATDFMWWLQFMRTGERDYYLIGDAQSRHSMDVGNVHWPTGPTYRGDTNPSLDYFRSRTEPGPTPYLGMGRRHARQQWTALLSAHVWVPGWIASYYLSGNHRGLEVAKMTGDYYLRRIFGDHGLTGRRLYLSVWNLTEIWDATKDNAYAEELHDRVDRMLQLQNEQGGNMTMDRYGYSQPYVARGLTKYLQMTGDKDVRQGLTRHARWVRDNPPLNHEMESYLATISTLLAGYTASNEPSFFREAARRAQLLKMDALSQPVSAFETQESFAEALESASRLPRGRNGEPGIWRSTGGLRVFGWTHMYHLPWLIHALETEGEPVIERSPLPPGY